MKIAFLNPWRNASETQVFQSMAVAAERIGHEMVQCVTSSEVAAAAPDFVLAVSATQPKLNDVPHYAVLHEPRDLFFTERVRYQNVLLRDGYLTISETLDRFARDLTFAIDRPVDTGFYFLTCQRQKLAADPEKLAAEGRLKVTYFGSNWDPERAELVRVLARYDGVAIYGPEDCWQDIDPKSRGGSVPFDGDSVQRRYVENGIGLCLLSERHFRDDAMSNRIFEIASVGAVAICVDIPWMRRHFGDTVYYVDQSLPRHQLAQQIMLRRKEIAADPRAAAEKARGARRIFEERFAAEVLLANAVEYHRRVAARRRATLAKIAPQAPLISVIVRCGSRPLKLLRRAVESLAAQTYGRFDVILVRHHAMDLSPLTEAPRRNIESMRVVDSEPGKRSASLWEGLRAVKGDYFAVLDDDDWLFSDHFEQLFRPLESPPRERFFAYSGTVSHDVRLKGKADTECRRLATFGITDASDLFAVSGAFTLHCFVASSDLLGDIPVEDPELASAEDSYLILSLLARAERPRFSYAATAVYECGRAGQSDFASDPLRFENELTIQLRLHARHRPLLQAADGFAALETFWKQRPVTGPKKNVPLLATFPAELLIRRPVALKAKKCYLAPGSQVLNPASGECLLWTPPEPWIYASELALEFSETPRGAGLIVLQLEARSGPMGVGVLDHTAKDFLSRVRVEACETVQSVYVPMENWDHMGRLVVQNWDVAGARSVQIRSIEVWTELPDEALE